MGNSKKDKQVVIRIDTKTYDKLVKASAKDLRTVSGYIRLVLANHLKGGN